MSNIYIAHISDLTQPITENMLSKLTPQRKARMCRYRQHSDKLRCVAAALLARLGAQEFFSDTNVQVFMPAGMPPYSVSGNKVCRMSISHTADRVMCMTDSEDCGVDIESEHACREAVGLAERYFFTSEAAWICAAETETLRAERFARIWTAKEAYLKYCATGLQRGLDTFCITACDDGVSVTDPMMPAAHLYSIADKDGCFVYTAFSRTPVERFTKVESDVLFCD